MKRSRRRPRIRSLDLAFRVDPVTRERLLELLHAFTEACDAVRSVAAKSECSTPPALQALAYRQITPKRGPGLPSQYAVRAINRVSHQLRLQRHALGDPYPAHSLDLDSRTCSLAVLTGALAITPLEARHVRGGAARGHRISLGTLDPEDLAIWSSHVLLGAYLVVPTRGPVVLHARLVPDKAAKKAGH